MSDIRNVIDFLKSERRRRTWRLDSILIIGSIWTGICIGVGYFIGRAFG